MLRAVSPSSPWRAFLMDLAIVLVFSVTHFLVSALAPDDQGHIVWWPLLVSIPATCLLLVRRRFPWVVLVLEVAAATTLVEFNSEIGVLNLVILVAVYSVCAQTSLTGTVIASVIAMIYPCSELQYMQFGDGVIRIVAAVVNLVMIVGWARAMRVGRRRAVQLEQTVTLLDEARDQMATDAAVVERARIAREFHDIVSHNLSVVALRAGVARALVDQDPEHARNTLHELEQTSRSALQEMRHLLSALREDPVALPAEGGAPGEREEAERQPAPRLDRVDALLDTVQGTGVVWRLDRRGTVRELGSGVEMTAYRVVQEAVTNILKHAGAGYARVLLDYGVAALRVEVTNHAAGPGPQPTSQLANIAVRDRILPASGHGLVGLRERVALLGGTLAAHPVPGGFHLAAVLPFRKISDLA